MGSIIANGKRVETPFSVVNFLDNPACKLGSRSYRKRTADEVRHICAIVCHSTAGIPGGRDLREQILKPGVGPNDNAGPFYSKLWQNDTSKYGGAHFVIGYDGQIYQCADIVTDAAYHAGAANGNSVGIEVHQDRKDAGFWECEIEANTNLIVWLTTFLGIQRQIQALPYKGPISCLTGKLYNKYGTFCHRDLTNNRGKGDPGDLIPQALVDVGFEQFDFSQGEDIEVWKERQEQLGIVADGIPGPGTVRALKEAGYPDGLWILV